MFAATMFYYGQECYFPSKQLLIIRITSAVCLHSVNYSVCTVAANICLEMSPYGEVNWEGLERKYSLPIVM